MDRQQYDRIMADGALRAEIEACIGARAEGRLQPEAAGEPRGGPASLGRETVRPMPDDRAWPGPETAAATLESTPGVPAGLSGLAEAIVLRLGRPSLLVRNDTFEVPPSDVWRTRLLAAKSRLDAAIRSVGRVEVVGLGAQFVGTAWVVAPGVVVTNRHVALLFARGRGTDVALRLSPGSTPYVPRVDFAEEYAQLRPLEVGVRDVLYIADDSSASPDLAFLLLDAAAGELPPPIPLADTDPAAGQVVVTIGYPAQDWRNDPADQARIFGGIFDVKRLAPGEVGVVEPGRFTHDCTTLGGSSGSVVLDVETGQAVGLHFAGQYLQANYAVTAGVVREHMDLAGVAVPSPDTGLAARALPRQREPAAASVADLTDRRGFDERFLGSDGLRVPLPRLTQEVAARTVVVDRARRGRRRCVLDYQHFSVALHEQRRLALYTASNIDGSRTLRLKRERDRWQFDPRIDERFQVGEELYAGNDLDRGHLVRRLDPAWGDKEAALRGAADTFFFTNCSPQHAHFNQRLWLELENYLLDNASTRGFKASVFTGPVLTDSDPVYRGVQLPQAFWKVAVMVHDERGALTATGYLVSQADLITNIEFVYGQFRTYQLPLRRLEGLTGLDFGVLRDADPLAGQEAATPRELVTVDDIVL